MQRRVAAEPNTVHSAEPNLQIWRRSCFSAQVGLLGLWQSIRHGQTEGRTNQFLELDYSQCSAAAESRAEAEPNLQNRRRSCFSAQVGLGLWLQSRFPVMMAVITLNRKHTTILQDQVTNYSEKKLFFQPPKKYVNFF